MSLLRYRVNDVNSNMFNEIVVINNSDENGFHRVNTMSGKVGHFTMDQLTPLILLKK
jgi:hypothetical protein